MKKKTARIESPAFNSAGYQVNMKDLNGEPLPDPSKLDFRPFKHGGARVGAGRKPTGRQAVLLRLNPKVISALRKEAGRNRKSLSHIAEEYLAQRLRAFTSLAGSCPRFPDIPANIAPSIKRNWE